MIVIIGAGIAGLYLGWELYKQNKKFIILEKSKRTGGKLISKYTTYDEPVEIGASIFHSNQKIIMSLIQEFNIETKVKKLPSTTYYDEIECPEELKYPKRGKGKVEDVIPEIELCGSHFDEIREMNYNTWKKSYDNVKQILMCKNGLQELVDKMTEKLRNHIFLNHSVERIGKNYVFTKDKRIKYKNVIISTSSMAAKKIKGIKQDVFKLIKTIPSFRFYLELNFDMDTKYDYIVSDKLYRWAIILSPRLLLASYTDGKRAERINNLGENKSKEIILSELGIKLEEVVNSWYAYWKDGFDIVRWNANPEKVKKSIKIQPHIYQTFVPDTERNGQDQSWFEAHLQTAKSVLKSLKIDIQ